VRSGEQVYRRLTNGNGEFRFAGLEPGTWTVMIDPDKLPENATAVPPFAARATSNRYGG
jgi:hypothetical protein